MAARRPGPGEIVVGASGLLLLLAMFLPWFGLDGRVRVPGVGAITIGAQNLNAWEAFGVIDIVLACAAVLAIALLAVAYLREPPPGLVLAVICGAGLGALLVLFRLIDPPNISVDVPGDASYETARRLGAFFGLLCTAGMTWGANLIGLPAEAPARRKPATAPAGAALAEPATAAATTAPAPAKPPPAKPKPAPGKPKPTPAKPKSARVAEEPAPSPTEGAPAPAERSPAPLKPARPPRKPAPASPAPAARDAAPAPGESAPPEPAPPAEGPPPAPRKPARPPASPKPTPAAAPPAAPRPAPPKRSRRRPEPAATPQPVGLAWSRAAIDAACQPAWRRYDRRLAARYERYFEENPELAGEQRASARDLAAALPPGWGHLAAEVPPDAWNRQHLSGKSAQTLGVGLLGVAAKRDPSLRWLWDALQPLPPPEDDAPQLEFEHTVAPDLLGERPRQTSFDALVDDPAVVIGIEVKWRHHGVGACLCRGEGIGPAEGERCSKRVEARPPYWDAAGTVIGRSEREPGAPCPVSPLYEVVRHAAALRALAGPERAAVLLLLYDEHNPYFAQTEDWPGWPSLLEEAVAANADTHDFRLVTMPWQALAGMLPLDDPTRAWAGDKHGLD